MRLKFAALRQSACVEDIDLRTPRGIDRAVFAKLAGGDWIDRHENLLITGATGLGKSWIACALGHKACRDNRSVLYYRVPRLFEALAIARNHCSPSAKCALSVRIILGLAILCFTLKLRPDRGLINHGPDAFDRLAHEAIEDVLSEGDASAVDGQPEHLAPGSAVEEQS